LINLTCGRNPWKKASIEDSTFTAFLRNSKFLKSILPLTEELDCILRRIFECDPAKRITIPELRSMIIRCPAFTTISSTQPLLPSPLCRPVDFARYIPLKAAYAPTETFYLPQIQLPLEVVVYANSPTEALATQLSQLSTSNRSSGSDTASVFSSVSSSSSASSSSSYTAAIAACQPATAPLEEQCHCVTSPPNSWYTNFMPALDLAQKHMSFHPFFSGVRVF